VTSGEPGPSLPSFRLDDRLAVVTGASEGIGRTLAVAFAAAGAEIILFSRRQAKLDEVAAEIGAAGGRATGTAGDVTNGEDVAALAAMTRARAESSGRAVVLVNNAGIGFTKPVLEITEQDWDDLFAVHARATFFCCKAIAPIMLARGYGKIINMSSTWSESTDTGKVAYSAAKAAISRLTAALSTEWAPLGVRVNALAPTTTMTDFTARAMEANPERAARLLSKIRLGRYATPADLVGPAIFLASEASDFVTGHTLFVDGGWHGAS
jgi:NAD(P)-dependent dehydrogenase (short-subunit alcohol dehydrogenase family)